LIEIESYLRNRDGSLVNVGDAEDPPANSRHVEGAIDLSIDGIQLLDRCLWDDVDQLWGYIGNMLAKLRESDGVSTYFPDQPIKLAFERLSGGRLIVSVEGRPLGRRAAAADENELVAALSRSARTFFEKMSTLIPENRSLYEETGSRFPSE
jgi:hypothetical protein